MYPERRTGGVCGGFCEGQDDGQLGRRTNGGGRGGAWGDVQAPRALRAALRFF